MFKHSAVLLLFVLFFSSCLEGDTKANKPVSPPTQGHYFSINDYIKQQWATYRGHPFGIMKVVRMNDHSDTLYLNSFEIEIGKIVEVFSATDISTNEHVGQYDFSLFADDITMSINYFYEAKSPDLYTQRLQIMADDVTHLVKSIYIETDKKTTLNTIHQKLTYKPAKRISIYEKESSKVGPSKEVNVDYIFM